MERVKLLESDKAVRFVIDQVMFRVFSRREHSHAGLISHSQTTDTQPHSLTLCSWVDSNMNAKCWRPMRWVQEHVVPVYTRCCN